MGLTANFITQKVKKISKFKDKAIESIQNETQRGKKSFYWTDYQ